MTTVTWTCDTELRKHFIGDMLQSLRYKGRVIFHDLKVIDRVRAGLPTTKPNPNFEPDLPISSENPETIPMIDTDTNHVIVVTGSIDPDESKAKATIIAKMNRNKANWEQRLKAKPERAIVTLSEDDNFV